MAADERVECGSYDRGGSKPRLGCYSASLARPDSHRYARIDRRCRFERPISSGDSSYRIGAVVVD